VVEHQRHRLLQAVPGAVSAERTRGLTVEDICVWAGVSRRTFYENFRDNTTASSLLATCDRGDVGRRDLAVLMLLSRNGLRAREVAAIQLDDID
jgi:integrase